MFNIVYNLCDILNAFSEPLWIIYLSRVIYRDVCAFIYVCILICINPKWLPISGCLHGFWRIPYPGWQQCYLDCTLGAAHKLIGNALQISARVCKVKLAMNLVHIGKISCLCLLSKCLCAVFMVFRASIQQYIPDLLPNWLCRLLQISAKHCLLVSVPPLKHFINTLGFTCHTQERYLPLWAS